MLGITMPTPRTRHTATIALAALVAAAVSLTPSTNPRQVLADGRDVVVYDDNPAEGEQTCAFYRRQDPTVACTVKPTSQRPLISLNPGDRAVA
ncbi:hypothetical protein [Pseudonocardia spinosispora]|uniref:hypothetical protein n=1 Tax=Pseudonocardia spinosispora TaxID=103441 RepID=UPI0003FD4B5E|nr:hypothetical protein [Pseudonocardia spinosispora]